MIVNIGELGGSLERSGDFYCHYVIGPALAPPSAIFSFDRNNNRPHIEYEAEVEY